MMGKLAQQLGGQSQVSVANSGTKKRHSEAAEPKAEERREAKMSPKARAKVEKMESFKKGKK